MDRHPIRPLQPDQLARLPKYAQDQVRDLERRIADLERDLAVAKGEAKPGRIVATDPTGPTRIVVPDDYDVEFDLGGQPGGAAEIESGSDLSITIRNTACGRVPHAQGVRYLQVMSSGGTLVALNTSSNVVALVPGHGAYEAIMEAAALSRGVAFIAERRRRQGIGA